MPSQMRYRLLGRAGLRVSEFGLGTMTFGEEWGWGASPAESRRMFDAYVARGGNFLDTSNNYTDGTSERLVGEFVHTDRDRFVVATKFTVSDHPGDPNASGNHRKNLMRSVQGSLRRLGTDYLDLLWLHMWDGTTRIDEVMRELQTTVPVHVRPSAFPVSTISGPPISSDSATTLGGRFELSAGMK